MLKPAHENMTPKRISQMKTTNYIIIINKHGTPGPFTYVDKVVKVGRNMFAVQALQYFGVGFVGKSLTQTVSKQPRATSRNGIMAG